MTVYENQSDTLTEFAKALIEAQNQFPPAIKNALNPHLRSKYADLASVVEAVRKTLYENDFAIIQAPEPDERGIRLRTTLLHKSGEWMASTLTIPAVKQDAQSYGSALSYARRYAISSMLGIVTDDDDDGERATTVSRARTDIEAAANGREYVAPARNASNVRSTKNWDRPTSKQREVVEALLTDLGWKNDDFREYARTQGYEPSKLSAPDVQKLIGGLRGILAGAAPDAVGLDIAKDDETDEKESEYAEG